MQTPRHVSDHNLSLSSLSTTSQFIIVIFVYHMRQEKKCRGVEPKEDHGHGNILVQCVHHKLLDDFAQRVVCGSGRCSTMRQCDFPWHHNPYTVLPSIKEMCSEFVLVDGGINHAALEVIAENRV